MRRLRGKSTKWILFGFVVLLACSSAGCRGDNVGEGAASGSKRATEDEAKLHQLSYWALLNDNAAETITNMADHEVYRYKKAVTGVDATFMHPQSDEAFNLMIASKKMPDVIEANWIHMPGGPEKYIRDGNIIILNDYIDQYAPNFAKMLRDKPEMRKMISTDNGLIYAFPFFRRDEDYLTSMGLALRKNWLERLQLQLPETIEDWHTVLKAFKDRDPNHNGLVDEVPLYYKWSDLGFQTAWGIVNEFYQEDGVVKFGMLQPGFKEYVTTLRNWYMEGLIDPEYAIMDEKQRDAKLERDILGAYVQLLVGQHNDIMGGQNPKFEMMAAPYPVVEKGTWPIIGQQSTLFTGVGAAISGSALQVQEIVKWLDFNYSEQGYMLFNFGIEGKSYTLVNHYPKLSEAVLQDRALLGRFTLAMDYGPFVRDKRWMEQQVDGTLNGASSLATWKRAENRKHLPPVTPTAVESSELSTIMKDIRTYSHAMLDKYVMGIEPMSSYDSFVRNLEDLGIERAIEIQQTALSRYIKR
jgi:putative aldouronate transport system substrate-binding protein